MPRGPGTVQQKILLLLLGGLTLGLSRSPRQHFHILKCIAKEWQAINRQALWRSIRGLYKSKLVEGKNNKDGTITLILSKDGRKKALQYRVDDMEIKKQAVWDRKWRIITFDVPEYQKKTRDALRQHFKRIGLKEFQKSVFVSPYPCDDEIDFLIELHHARSYVRIILAESIDNERHFRVKFSLPI